MYTEKELFHSLFSPLNFFLMLADLAYNKYVSNKIFVHAHALFLANKRTVELLTVQAGKIPEKLTEDFLQLLNHYDIWMTQFKLHEQKFKPAETDAFVFFQPDDQCAFPKESVARINEYYHHLKERAEGRFTEA